MEKLKLQTQNIFDKNILSIKTLFPNCITEAKDENGNLKYAIDFEQLKQELSDTIIDGEQERYRLDWPGKRQALITANTPITKTLRPYPDENESVDFDTTKNIFIEGDNLDALKLLQETYLGKVKMIYIDPPYNTGKDFVYRDNFTQNTDEFMLDTNQKDDCGNRLIANPETNGRFHSDWLSMIYPRLKLARNLLSDDGVIFISIDDNEQANLKKVCDEIFGEENFVACFIWQRAYSPVNMNKNASPNHDFIMCFAKNLSSLNNLSLPRTDEANNRYKNPDNDPRGLWTSADFSVGPAIEKNIYPIITPSGKSVFPPNGYSWRFSKEKFEELIKDNRVSFGDNGSNVPRFKRFLSDVKDGITPLTIWTYKEVGHSQDAKKELKNIFDGQSFFDYPKPVSLINRILQIATAPNDIILDFFAGSGTTAHAVMQLNAEDNGNRQFILCQIPEKTLETSEAFKAGYKTIADISKERIRRAGAKIKAENPMFTGDTGFRVLKIDTSNMNDIYYTPDKTNQSDLLLAVDNIKHDRTPDDLLFHVLLDWGVDLSLPIARKTIMDKTVFFVNTEPYDLIACFDSGITEDLIKELAKTKPVRVVFRDNGFENDSVKINAHQIFKQLSPSSAVKTI